MSDAIFQTPAPRNEPVLPYLKGDAARKELDAKVKELRSSVLEIPLIIGGKEVRTGRTINNVEPHNHGHVLAKVHQAGPEEAEAAIKAALAAKKEWENLPWQDRAAVFLKAADLLAGKYRSTINASTMLNQSKTSHQAEIDAACELIDFYRFNAAFLQKIYADQPESAPGIWNRMEYRALEGFVFAITPFNFTSIGANLPTAPAMLGNVALWKPSDSSVFSNYFAMKVLMEAGLPPGVINFIPGPAGELAPAILKHRDLAGVHFTGSTHVFRDIWKTIGNNMPNYRSFPRIVGETGGKDFIFAHGEADPKEVATAMVRGAYEFQGQKCSAASRAYVARSIWPAVEKEIGSQLSEIKMGDPTEAGVFVGAVIHEQSFDKIMGYIERARTASGTKILFGPVLTVYVYEDKDFEATLKICDETSPYALTGAFFAKDRRTIAKAAEALKHSAGNFYINDKPTGAVVGQQPFGGARASGTNDKAGSVLNLIRWTSPRAIKETFSPPTNYRYPFLD